MKKAILGKKLGMTQVFTADGVVIPVTVVEAGPCYVMQKKTIENDGYESLVVAYQDKKEKLVNKPDAGQFKKAGIAPKKYIREIDVDAYKDLAVGAEIKCSVFEEGDKVDVKHCINAFIF